MDLLNDLSRQVEAMKQQLEAMEQQITEHKQNQPELISIYDIDPFSKAKEPSEQTKNDLKDGSWQQIMKTLSEDKIKKYFGEICGVDATMYRNSAKEIDGDIMLNVSFRKEQHQAAILLKGPAGGTKFRSMQISFLGSRGDQVLQMFEGSACTIFIIQHCHSIGSSVKKHVEDSAPRYVKQNGKKCYHCLLDGRDTYQILKYFRKI